jgi:hypothetical protein
MEQNRFAGYAFLIEHYRLDVMPHWHISSIIQRGVMRSTKTNGRVETFYPQSYWPGDRAGGHLEFALKYDGVNLSILSLLFEKIPEKEITSWIASKPTGKYARRIWFLYEFLTERRLALPDLKKGNYVEVLEPDLYYTTIPGLRIQRQRIINNLLGGRAFCPVIRRTEKLDAMEDMNLRDLCGEVVAAYPPELLRRALSYLYSKETKSSFEIERIKPNASRTEKFMGLLEIAGHKDFCEKKLLLDLQNLVVDPRFQDSDYRKSQNYVGQAISYQKQMVHYICPKPEDLPEMMEGLLNAHLTMKEGGVPAIIHAAAISYGFVFMHPFEDGNGRIHRFLVHNILSLRGVVPEGLMFPVSAAMLKNPPLYDRSLEVFSIPLIRLVDFDLDELGTMTVHGETSRWYKYIDMTAQAEALFDFIKITIENEMAEELDFLAKYDKTKRAIQEIADMPDHLIDLFIQLCLGNNGSLSARKRKTHFAFLSGEEVAGMEKAIAEGYGEN